MKSFQRAIVAITVTIIASLLASNTSGKLISEAVITKTLVLLDNWAT